MADETSIGSLIQQHIVNGNASKLITLDAPGICVPRPGRKPGFLDLEIHYNHATGEISSSPDMREVWRHVAKGNAEYSAMLDKYCDAVAEFFSTLKCEVLPEAEGKRKIMLADPDSGMPNTIVATPASGKRLIQIVKLEDGSPNVHRWGGPDYEFGKMPGDHIIEQSIAKYNKMGE